MNLVPCPNPACDRGHTWRKGDDPCSCPVLEDWDDVHGRIGRKDHDLATCETLCPCCFGEEEVPEEEAREWMRARKGAA